MRRKSTLLVVGTVAAIAVGVAGTSQASETGKASATPAAIKVMVSSPVVSPAYAFPEIMTNTIAALQAQNKRGGINGVKIQIERCDNGNDPNKTLQCAQKAVQNNDVALVSSYALQSSSSFYGPIEQAKLPLVGNAPAGPKDWSSPMAFPVAYTSQAYVAAPVLALKRIGCKKISAFAFEDKAYDPFVKIARDTVRRAKLSYAGEVRFPYAQADFSAQVQTAVGQTADCIVYLGESANHLGLVRALRNSGKKIKLGGLGPQWRDNLKALGTQLDGSAFAEPSPSPTVNPAKDAPPLMKQYAKEMRAAGKTSAKDVTLQGFSGWLGAQLFIQAAKTIPKGKVTRATLVAALNKTDFNPKGVAGRSDFRVKGPITDATRLHNFTMYLKTIKNGKVVPLQNGLVDLTSQFKGTTAFS